MHWSSRPVAVVLTLLLFAAAAGDLCAGWHPSAEARLACCLDGACEMHRGTERVSTHQGAPHDAPVARRASPAPSQQDADTCCAMSATESTPAAPALTFDVILEPLAGPAVASASVARGLIRPKLGQPLRSAAVARHVLISVFQI